jgi:hypothetical protein
VRGRNLLANIARLVGVRRDIQRYVADDESIGIVRTDIIVQKALGACVADSPYPNEMVSLRIPRSSACN